MHEFIILSYIVSVFVIIFAISAFIFLWRIYVKYKTEIQNIQQEKQQFQELNSEIARKASDTEQELISAMQSFQQKMSQKNTIQHEINNLKYEYTIIESTINELFQVSDETLILFDTSGSVLRCSKNAGKLFQNNCPSHIHQMRQIYTITDNTIKHGADFLTGCAHEPAEYTYTDDAHATHAITLSIHSMFFDKSDTTLQQRILMKITDVTDQTIAVKESIILHALAEEAKGNFTEQTITATAAKLLAAHFELPLVALVCFQVKQCDDPHTYAHIVFVDHDGETQYIQQEFSANTFAGSPWGIIVNTKKAAQYEGAALQSFPMIAPNIRKILGEPLFIHDELIGVAVIGLSHSFVSAGSMLTPTYLHELGDKLADHLLRGRFLLRIRNAEDHDVVSHLFTHRVFLMKLNTIAAACRENNKPFSLILANIDHFRQINEQFGVEVGDKIIHNIGRIITKQIPCQGIAARNNAEEFAIALPDYNAEDAAKICEEMRADVENVSMRADNGVVRCTISIGVAAFPAHTTETESLMRAAGIALHTAKHMGRNQCKIYGPELISGGIAYMPLKQGEDCSIMLPTGEDLDSIHALVRAVDLRDGYTGSHSTNVSLYAVSLGECLHLPMEHIETLRIGGLIHDVGKIGISDKVLLKPGKLDAQEWILMKSHTVLGEEILHSIKSMRHLLPLVRWHHEKLDGSGYPDGLAGDEIPLLVRILTIVDIFEAFTAERPYHPGRTQDEGIQLLLDETTQGKLDSDLVRMFIQYLKSTSAAQTKDTGLWPRAA